MYLIVLLNLFAFLIITNSYADQYAKVDNSTVAVVKISSPQDMTIQQAREIITNLSAVIKSIQDRDQKEIKQYQDQIMDIELGFQSTLGIDVSNSVQVNGTIQ